MHFHLVLAVFFSMITIKYFFHGLETFYKVQNGLKSPKEIHFGPQLTLQFINYL